MAGFPLTPSIQHRGASTSLSSVVTLASWQLRRTWFLLLMTTLGMIAAVIIACAVPLFSAITTTAGLRGTLREQPYSSEINLDVTPLGLSSHLVQDVRQQFEPLFQKNLGTFLSGEPQFSLTSSNFAIISPLLKVPPMNQLQVQAASMQQAASHLQLTQGQLPSLTNKAGNEVGILLTPETAKALGVHVGSTMELELSFFTTPPDPSDVASFTQALRGVPLKAYVSGLFNINEANTTYWHGNDFNPYEQVQEKSSVEIYSMLVPLEGLLRFFDGVSTQYHIGTPFTLADTTLSWYYRLDSLHVSITQLDDLISRLSHLKTTIDTKYGDIEGLSAYSYSAASPPAYPYLGHVNLFSPLLRTPGMPGNLEQFENRVSVARIPVFVVSVQILALLLFFGSLMTDLLVDRQSDAIAILRSRGASRGQVFGALLTQSVGLGILAILLGLPLALLVALFVSQRILPSTLQDAVNVVTNTPVQTMLATIGYAGAVVLVMVLTMSFSLARAARTDVLSARRRAARSTQRPLWQRLHVDIIAGFIALTGYAVSVYLTSIGAVLSASAKALISVPLSLIAPFFLVLGCLLLFLRFFPLLLRLGAELAVRGRSAVSMLALAQMARAPGQAMRMTLLLALTIAFAFFSLIFIASQEQRSNDLATYQVGADFSGTYPDHGYQLPLQQQTAMYQSIPGVLSASTGYRAGGTVGGGNIALTIELSAVDTRTFGSTAIWPFQSLQPLSSQLSLLDSKRQYGIANNVVPVVVDAMVQSKLALHTGSTFILNLEDDSLLIKDVHCVVVSIVDSIPTSNTNAESSTSASDTPSGTILVDYRTYNAVYSQEVQPVFGPGYSLPLNYVWLRTKSTATSLAHVRAALSTSTLALENLEDRRALLDQLRTDPLPITLVGILSVGTAATLLLIVLGDLLASWLSARSRLSNFAVLRALGSSPQQVASVLIWEQGLLYIAGLLLGVAFGTLLSLTVIPPLITNNSNTQSPLPAHLIVPVSLLIAFVALLVVFVVALSMMVRVVSQPSMSQTLRLNED